MIFVWDRSSDSKTKYKNLPLQYVAAGTGIVNSTCGATRLGVNHTHLAHTYICRTLLTEILRSGFNTLPAMSISCRPQKSIQPNAYRCNLTICSSLMARRISLLTLHQWFNAVYHIRLPNAINSCRPGGRGKRHRGRSHITLKGCLLLLIMLF